MWIALCAEGWNNLGVICKHMVRHNYVYIYISLSLSYKVHQAQASWISSRVQERSWEHYGEQVMHFAKQSPLTFLWVYL